MKREESCAARLGRVGGQAVLEGVAFAIRDSVEVARSLGIVIDSSKVCGGGAKSPLWKTILANVLNATLECPASEQGPGMGGAMDLVAGAENVIVITTHTDKKGGAKILKKCTLPLTAYKRVKWIITELAVIEVVPEGLVLREVNAESSVEEVVAKTEATLIIPENVATF